MRYYPACKIPGRAIAHPGIGYFPSPDQQVKMRKSDGQNLLQLLVEDNPDDY